MPNLFAAEHYALPKGPLKLIRLLRLARLARLLHAFPELMTMVKGIVVATRAVGSAMLLLIIAIYGWAIAMHSFMKDDAKTNKENGDDALDMYWGTVTKSMMTLMGNGTLGDEIGTVMRGVANKPEALTALIAFIIFSMLIVLNMLVGLLCEVVTEVAQAEKEHSALSKLKSTLLVMLKRIDTDGSGDISKLELLCLLQDEEAVAVMEELNIDVDYFIDILDMHYHKSEDVKIPSIMKLLIASQGERATTVADLCSFSTFTHWTMESLVDSVHVEIQLVKRAMNGSEQMLQDMDDIKKELASLTQLHCRDEAGEGMIAIDQEPFRTTLADGQGLCCLTAAPFAPVSTLRCNNVEL